MNNGGVIITTRAGRLSYLSVPVDADPVPAADMRKTRAAVHFRFRPIADLQ